MRIGVVPYLNALPLCFYLKHPVHFATPVELDKQMSTGSLDVALLPIVSLFENRDFHPLFEAGVIQSSGPVQSVVLFYKDHLEKPTDITSIKWTTESRTSVALFKVLYTFYWGLSLDGLDQTSNNPDAFLEIGDKALFFDKPGFRRCDLGQVWTHWTKLPFVYASWASRETPSQELIDSLIKAKINGLKNIDEIVKNNHDLPLDRLRHYLTKSIQYEMAPESIEGIRLFKDYCFKLRLFDKKSPLEAIKPIPLITQQDRLKEFPRLIT